MASALFSSTCSSSSTSSATNSTLANIFSIAKVDSAKPPKAFGGTSGNYIESWVLVIELYFAANESLTDNQKAIRMALSLSGMAQEWFYNIFDFLLDQLTLSAMETEILNAF